jgi:hypothetical protein
LFGKPEQPSASQNGFGKQAHDSERNDASVQLAPLSLWRSIAAGDSSLLFAMPQDFRQLGRGALYTGLRLGELQALTVSDFGDGQLHVRHSKGGKERTVPLSPEASSFSTKLQRERQAILCFFSRIRVGSGSTRAGTWLAPARQRRSPRPQYFMSCAAVTAACYSIEAPGRR